MLDSREAVFWCLAFFFTFVVVLVLLIKFWVGSFNKYDQNGMLEDGLDDLDSNDEEVSEDKIELNRKECAATNNNIRRTRDYQQQISLQCDEGGMTLISSVFKKNLIL